jgi:DNA gyrase subunit A
MEVGLVQKIDIDNEMQQAYLDYAMSVIIARALPDARDGLKPVHRRILYAMYDMGLRPDSAYKKSARIVGEVLGKYHPHGDQAVYEAMARMAQESPCAAACGWSGNFCSVDGTRRQPCVNPNPAWQRHHGITGGIQKDTVNLEPISTVRLKNLRTPSAIQTCWSTGPTGIAVGYVPQSPA